MAMLLPLIVILVLIMLIATLLESVFGLSRAVSAYLAVGLVVVAVVAVFAFYLFTRKGTAIVRAWSIKSRQKERMNTVAYDDACEEDDDRMCDRELWMEQLREVAGPGYFDFSVMDYVYDIPYVAKGVPLDMIEAGIYDDDWIESLSRYMDPEVLADYYPQLDCRKIR